MPLTDQPTKIDASIGRVKSDARAIDDIDTQVPAAEFERLKDFLIDVCDEVGNHEGEEGSLNARLAAVEVGTPHADTHGVDGTDRILRVELDAGDGAEPPILFDDGGTERGALYFETLNPAELVVRLNAGDAFRIKRLLSEDTDHEHAVVISPLINQSGTGGWSALTINPVIALADAGAGEKRILDARILLLTMEGPVEVERGHISDEGHVRFGSGSEALPALSFAAHPTTGLRDEGGILVAVTGATDIAAFLDDHIACFVPLHAADGTDGEPEIASDSDQATGIRWPSANVLRFVTQGTARADLSNTELSLLTGALRLSEIATPTSAANSAAIYAADVGGTTKLQASMPGSEVWVLTHPSTTPAAVGRAASLGTATQLARADHVHDGGIVEDVAIDDGDSPWTLVVTEEVIYVDSQAGSVTIALPAAVTGGHRSWTIVQIDGDAGTDITLDPFGGEEINGVNANFDLPGSDDAGVRAWLLLCDGAAWWVV